MTRPSFDNSTGDTPDRLQAAPNITSQPDSNSTSLAHNLATTTSKHKNDSAKTSTIRTPMTAPHSRHNKTNAKAAPRGSILSHFAPVPNSNPTQDTTDVVDEPSSSPHISHLSPVNFDHDETTFCRLVGQYNLAIETSSQQHQHPPMIPPICTTTITDSNNTNHQISLQQSTASSSVARLRLPNTTTPQTGQPASPHLPTNQTAHTTHQPHSTNNLIISSTNIELSLDRNLALQPPISQPFPANTRNMLPVFPG